MPTPAAFEAAVRALYRIRAVETEPDPTGHKTVWHQCAQGADLVSTVDPSGRVTRQEFILLGDYFVWEKGHPVMTGSVDDGGSSGFSKPMPVLDRDPSLTAQRLGRATNALGSYAGDDRYIAHLRRMFVARSFDGEEPVTHVMPGRKKSAAVPEPTARTIRARLEQGLRKLGQRLRLKPGK